jgi:hypothetical protein
MYDQGLVVLVGCHYSVNEIVGDIFGDENSTVNIV